MIVKSRFYHYCLIQVIKNISSSTYIFLKNSVNLSSGVLPFFLFSTFILEPILMKICMNAYHQDTIFFIKSDITWNVTFMFWRSFAIFYIKTFWPNYNIDLRSYGQLLSLFHLNLPCFASWKILQCVQIFCCCCKIYFQKRLYFHFQICIANL